MDANDLALKALKVCQSVGSRGVEEFDAAGATFFRNRLVPGLADWNHVTNVRVVNAAEIDTLLERAEVEYDGCPHKRFDLDFTTSPEFEARLICDGYSPSASLIMVLEENLVGEPKPYEIRLVDDDAGWSTMADFKRHPVDWAPGDADLGHLTEGGTGDDEGQDILISDPAYVVKSASPPYRYWIAYVDGQAAAYCSSWSGIDSVGEIDDLVTRRDYRHRGIATALVHHCVADVRADGAAPVVIVTDANDTPKDMYAGMGFRPVAVTREYLKKM